MNYLSNRLKHHWFFIYGYILMLVTGIALLLAKGKEGIFLLLNTYHSSWADYFFTAYTDVGDGLFAIALALMLYFVFKKYKLGVTIVVAFLFTGLVAQIIKPFVHSPRPALYFAPRHLSFFIDSIIHSGNTSFPSGHTITIFAVTTILALYTSNKWYQLLLLIVAAAVGFSRVYLSQHFLLDVIAGSVIGFAGAILCVYWMRNIEEKKLVFGIARRKMIK